jgi:UrcA family protein
MNMNRRGMCLVTTLIMAGVLIGPVFADDAETGVRKARVTYADLDITRPPDAVRLYKRIQSAAVKVCAPASQYPIHTARARCVHDAISRAVADVRAPELSRYHAMRTGSPVPSAIAARQP